MLRFNAINILPLRLTMLSRNMEPLNVSKTSRNWKLNLAMDLLNELVT